MIKKFVKSLYFVILMFLVLIVSAYLLKIWWLFWTFSLIAVVIAIFEWYATYRSGSTISNNFWDYSKNNKAKAWIMIACIAIGGIMLLWHFAIEML